MTGDGQSVLPVACSKTSKPAIMTSSHIDVYMMERKWPGILRPRWLCIAPKSTSHVSPLVEQSPTEDEVPALEYLRQGDKDQTPETSPITPKFLRLGLYETTTVTIEDDDTTKESGDVLNQIKELAAIQIPQKRVMLREMSNPIVTQQSYQIKKMVRTSDTDEQLYEKVQDYIKG